MEGRIRGEKGTKREIYNEQKADKNMVDINSTV